MTDSPAAIRALSLADLRPLVQQALALEVWPGDWEAAGQILTSAEYHYTLEISKYEFGTIEVRIMEKRRGIAIGVAKDFRTALFQGYVLWEATTKPW